MTGRRLTWRTTLLVLWLTFGAGALSRATDTPVAPETSAAVWPAANHLHSPDGEPGALVLPGGTGVSESSLASFVELAGSRRSRLLVIEVAASDADARVRQTALTARLFARWQSSGGQSFQVVRRSLDEFRSHSTDLAAISFDSVTGVWLNTVEDTSLKQFFAVQGVKEGCDAVRSRGGVIGGDVSFTRQIGAKGLGWSSGCAIVIDAEAKLDADQDSTTNPSARSTDKSPGKESVEAELAEHWKHSPLTVAMRLTPKSTLVVQGRMLRSANDTEIRFEFAPASGRPDQTVVLTDARRAVDLTALRRTAVERVSPLFPPAEPKAPHVDAGTLIIVGGGRTPRGLLEKFVELAGGSKASIVVIPVSMPDPLPEKDGMVEACRKLGAAEVSLLTGRTPRAVDQPETLERLRKATGIWFGGGRQWRFVDAYEGTQAFALMHDVLRRGGVIAGSSAGATIQGDYLVRGSPLGPQIMMADGYERAFQFLPGVGIDQHFTQRNRQPDMLAFVRRYPQFLGIGIDESTAIIVRGSIAETHGQSQVHFYDARRGSAENPHVDSLAAGQRYDLKERQAVGETPSPEETPADNKNEENKKADEKTADAKNSEGKP